MTLGIIILIGLQLIIYFGLAERVLNKLGLTKNLLLTFFTLMIIGSFIDIPISSTPDISINLGGAVVPVVLAVYILYQADDNIEVLRSIVAVIITGSIIYALTQVYQFEEGHTFIDSNYLFPIVAGVTAYIIGHSRRASFIAGTLGFLIYDMIHLLRITLGGVPGQAAIGGAGIFDSIVISGVLAVLLADIMGEIIERVMASRRGEKRQRFDEEFSRPDVEFGSLTENEEQDKEDNDKRGERDED